jgi:lysophospholipase L1-like esterase
MAINEQNILNELTQTALSPDSVRQIYRAILQSADESENKLLGKAGALGDSITALAIDKNSTVFNWEARGYITHLRQFGLGNIDLPSSRVWATSGFTLKQLIATHLPKALEAAAAGELNICFVMIGINSIMQGVDEYDAIADLKIIVHSLLDAGVTVVFNPILPTSVNLNTATIARRNHVNFWIKKQARLNPKNVFVPNTLARLTDATSNTGSPIAGVFYDGLHLNTKGAIMVAQENWECIKRNYISQIGLDNPADTYNEIDNQTGNLLTNGMLNGTGGAVSGTNITGVVADNWTYMNATSNGDRGGLVTTLSKTPRNDGQNGTRQTIVASGTAPTQIFTEIFRQTAASGLVGSGFSAGDIVVMECEIEIAAGSTGILQIGSQIAFQTKVSQPFITRDPSYFSTSGMANGKYDVPTTQKRLVSSEPFVIPDGIVNMFPIINISWANDAPCASTIHLDKITLRKAHRVFEPSQISNLAVWLDAADAPTVTLNSGNVREWKNKGNAGDAVQNIPSRQPSYIPASVGVKAALKGTGLSQLAIPNSAALANTQGHMFIVMQRASNQPSVGWVAGKTSTVGNQRQFRLQVQTGTNTNEGIVSADGQSAGSAVLSKPAVAIGTPYIAELSFFIEANGIKFSTTQDATPETATLTAIFNGSAPFTLFSREENIVDGSDCLIHEVLFFTKELSAGEEGKLMAFLRNKWGI